MSSHKTDIEAGLNEVIDAVQVELLSLNPFSEDFAKTLDQLDQLYQIKSAMKDNHRVNSETLLAVMGNLAGIVMILSYERVHVVASKALGFVIKSRV